MKNDFRSMKTIQELRALEGLKADSRDLDFENFSYRPRRSGIPTEWDDILRRDRERTWKNYRRTKWCA
jgi:hypothetical protein